MKKLLTLCLMLFLLAGVTLTAGCSSKPVLRIYNWADYIDESVLKAFEQEFNCTVQYSLYDDNETMLNKLKSTNSSYDVIFPSDYTIESMIKLNMLSKLDFANIPNFKNINSEFKNRSYDPKSEYSVPYMWGTIGILYNTTKVSDPITSWDILFNTKYNNQVLMMDSVRDALAVALFKLGYSMNSTDPAQIQQAKELLIQQKNTTVLAYGLDEIKDKMARGEAALALVYSGDARTAIDKNADLAYALPETGTNVWFDAMVVPANAKNKKLAEEFINYMCRTEVAMMNVEAIGYNTPVQTVFDLLDDSIKNDTDFYPTAEYLQKCEIFVDLGAKMKDYTDLWDEIKLS